MSKPVKVFITYAHKDADAKDELITRLAVMKRNGSISHWHDNEIIPGDKWRDAIFSNLAESDILLYLTSAASLASENCNKELAAALEGTKITVIPIILEACDWQEHPLSELEVLPHKGLPLNEWNPESKGWQNVVDGIRRAISQMQSPAPEQGQNVRLADRIFERGNFMMILQQFSMAIEAYSDVINLNPRPAAAYTNRGFAYFHNGDVDKAIDDYAEALKLDRALTFAYNGRGLAYTAEGKIDTAIADFTKAIKLNPDFAAAYTNRGIAYAAKGKIDSTIADFTEAIKLNSDCAAAYTNRGRAHHEKGEVGKAIADFTEAIKLNPNCAEIYSNRGRAYDDTGAFDEAIADFTKAIERNSNYAEAYNNRWIAYAKKGAFDEAIVDFTKAIELNSNYAEVYSAALLTPHQSDRT